MGPCPTPQPRSCRGPIGGARGSWIAAARQSLLEWPGEDLGFAVPVFGFSDALGKIVFDVTARHQLGFSLLAGQSLVDVDEDGQGGPQIQRAARTSVANISWRSMVGSTTVLTQRAYLVRQETVKPTNWSTGRRATRVPIGVLQSGAQLGRTTWNDGDQSTPVWTRSG